MSNKFHLKQEKVWTEADQLKEEICLSVGPQIVYRAAPDKGLNVVLVFLMQQLNFDPEVINRVKGLIDS